MRASAAALGRFDTIALFGNNFGLLADPRRARWLLRRLKMAAVVSASESRIVSAISRVGNGRNETIISRIRFSRVTRASAY